MVRRSAKGRSEVEVAPNLCGDNTGQHVYVDVGEEESEVKVHVRLQQTLGRTSPDREWRILVTQVDDGSKAPEGCLQFHRKMSSRVRSLNYDDNFADSLNYDICFDKLERAKSAEDACTRKVTNLEVTQPSGTYRQLDRSRARRSSKSRELADRAPPAQSTTDGQGDVSDAFSDVISLVSKTVEELRNEAGKNGGSNAEVKDKNSLPFLLAQLTADAQDATTLKVESSDQSPTTTKADEEAAAATESAPEVLPILYSEGNEGVISQIQQVVQQLQQEQLGVAAMTVNGDADSVILSAEEPKSPARAPQTEEAAKPPEKEPAEAETQASLDNISSLDGDILGTNRLAPTTSSPEPVTDNLAVEGFVSETVLTPNGSPVRIPQDRVQDERAGQESSAPANGMLGFGGDASSVDMMLEMMKDQFLSEYLGGDGPAEGGADQGPADAKKPSPDVNRPQEATQSGGAKTSGSTQAEITVLDPEAVQHMGDLVLIDRSGGDAAEEEAMARTEAADDSSAASPTEPTAAERLTTTTSSSVPSTASAKPTTTSSTTPSATPTAPATTTSTTTPATTPATTTTSTTTPASTTSTTSTTTPATTTTSTTTPATTTTSTTTPATTTSTTTPASTTTPTTTTSTTTPATTTTSTTTPATTTTSTFYNHATTTTTSTPRQRPTTQLLQPRNHTTSTTTPATTTTSTTTPATTTTSTTTPATTTTSTTTPATTTTSTTTPATTTTSTTTPATTTTSTTTTTTASPHTTATTAATTPTAEEAGSQDQVEWLILSDDDPAPSEVAAAPLVPPEVVISSGIGFGSSNNNNNNMVKNDAALGTRVEDAASLASDDVVSVVEVVMPTHEGAAAGSDVGAVEDDQVMSVVEVIMPGAEGSVAEEGSDSAGTTAAEGNAAENTLKDAAAMEDEIGMETDSVASVVEVIMPGEGGTDVGDQNGDPSADVAGIVEVIMPTDGDKAPMDVVPEDLDNAPVTEAIEAATEPNKETDAEGDKPTVAEEPESNDQGTEAEDEIIPLTPEEECGGAFLKVRENIICGSRLRGESVFEDKNFEDERFRDVERVSIRTMENASRRLRFSFDYATDCPVPKTTTTPAPVRKTVTLLQYLLGWYR
nr:flocculation protein FLO11-like [Penaeus vannamei]